MFKRHETLSFLSAENDRCFRRFRNSEKTVIFAEITFKHRGFTPSIHPPRFLFFLTESELENQPHDAAPDPVKDTIATRP